MSSIQGNRIAMIALCAVVAPAAFAQYVSDFESLTATADGTILTGQDGYFLPNGPALDTDFQAYRYTANSLRLPHNPTGGEKFIAGIGEANGTFERAQRLNGMGTTGIWTVGFDIAATFTGALPSAQNVGSFSLNEGVPGLFSIINLATWADPATATAWNANFVWFDSSGAQLQEQVADANFQNLAVNHWYRWETTFDLDTNQVLEVALTDLHTSTTWVNNPTGRYLRDGAAGNPNPDHLRFFAGGSVPGNSLAFDNPAFVAVPEPASLAALGFGALALLRRRRRA